MDGIRKNIPEELLTVKEKYRDRADLLRNRLDMLSGKDKLLMKMYWENGNSLRQISRLAGVNRATIGRRINKLTERLMEGQYITCLRNRNRFTKREMAIAKDYFMLGMSMKKIADKRNRSYYQVRQTLEKIQRLLATASTESSECKLTDYEN
jgi:predicted DNA-binding protein YlxM (UPF0122 family)